MTEPLKTTPRALTVECYVEGAEPRGVPYGKGQYRPERIAVAYADDWQAGVHLRGPRLRKDGSDSAAPWVDESLNGRWADFRPNWVREFVEAHRPEWAQP